MLMNLKKRSTLIAEEAVNCTVADANEKFNLLSINILADNLQMSNPELANKLRNNIGEVSDGYHTFNELYHHRAILFSVICNMFPDKAWKSLHHDDDTFPHV